MDRVQETKTFTVNGGRGHALEAREENDFYATSPLALRCLFRFFQDKGYKLSQNCLEPACGQGHLSELLKKRYEKVVSTDLINRGYGASGIDFLKTTTFTENDAMLCAGGDFDVITNPPYKYAAEFVNHSLDIMQPGRICAMYLKLIFLEGIGRYNDLFKKRPPKCVIVLPSRIGCCKGGNFTNVDKYGDPFAGSAIAFSWFIWVNGDFSSTTVDWFDPVLRNKLDV